jgi:hypothetical protein
MAYNIELPKGTNNKILKHIMDYLKYLSKKHDFDYIKIQNLNGIIRIKFDPYKNHYIDIYSKNIIIINLLYNNNLKYSDITLNEDIYGYIKGSYNNNDSSKIQIQIDGSNNNLINSIKYILNKYYEER